MKWSNLLKEMSIAKKEKKVLILNFQDHELKYIKVGWKVLNLGQ